ncbi:MAG: DUF1206 domain-containing protein [Propionibacteriaceae bacterium]
MTTEDRARQAGARVQHSKGYRALIAVGLASYGVVHLLIGWIAGQVAWGGGGGGGDSADKQGALKALAQTPLGPVLLVVVGVGLLTLVVWQGVEAAFGHGRVAQQHDEKRRTLKRISSAGRAVVYLVLGVSALRLVAGAGSSGHTEQTATGRLLALPLGRVLVLVVAAVVIGVGVAQIVRGVKKKFTEDLRGGTSDAVITLGTVGYVAKGAALGVVGALFGYAAITADAKKAGGIDAALHTIQQQPFGTFLLTAMALGFAAFGLFCFVWAKDAKV